MGMDKGDGDLGLFIYQDPPSIDCKGKGRQI